MKEITVHTGSKTYPVYIGSGAIKQLGHLIKTELSGSTRILILTDEHVAKLYLQQLSELMTGFEVFPFVVPAGEKAKTFEVYYDALTFALEHKLDRKSVILAFGGGAVGDLAGFVAASYMRGIPFIQIPTTILAHDSAVGGKVAINHPLGKNMIGAFYQPEAVIYDLDFLSSLPLREKRSGFAEVIKHTLLKDKELYEQLKSKVQSLETLDSEVLAEFLNAGIEIKAEIVAEDEKETGVRAFLNFGHTLGHAIEAEMGYGGWTHGESIAVGMIFALELSRKLTDLSFPLADFKEWLVSLGYNIEIPTHLSHEKLLERMKQDKKSVAGSVSFVLLTDIGNPVSHKVTDTLLLEEMAAFSKKGGEGL